ncbi:MFS transporter [Sphingomonas antarctica]|uniref:TCR/Tet family MFS transporter n=1 Tax=Sphingomonas antarctica TaxID=2040274 RepID=UPI0039EB5FEB
MTNARPHATLFVLVTIFIDAMSFGLIMPVLPRLLMNIGQIDLPRAMTVGAWIGFAMALATFFAAPVLGGLSDAHGRRRVLLLALGGLAVDYLLLAVAHTLPLIFIGRTMSGIFGGSYAPAQAALADRTAPEDRAKAFGYVGAAFGVGFIIGPAIGGLLGQMGDRAPFYAASALAAVNFLYGTFVFPETLPPERRRPFDWSRANPLGAWRVAQATPGMARIAAILVLWQIASLVYPLTWSFWAIAQLGWSSAMIGASLAFVGVIMALAQGLFTGPAVKRLGERNAATVGLTAATCAFLLYPFVTASWQVFAIMIVIAVQALTQPSLMALLSRSATPETQGETQGIASMAMGLGTLAAPLLLTGVMAHFTGSGAPVHLPGAAFLVSAAFALVCIVLVRRLPEHHNNAAAASATAGP